jgi:hypothetical protein
MIDKTNDGAGSRAVPEKLLRHFALVFLLSERMVIRRMRPAGRPIDIEVRSGRYDERDDDDD